MDNNELAVIDSLGFDGWLVNQESTETAIEQLEDVSFSYFVYDTIPRFFWLFLIVFILNWIFSIIADVCHLGSRPKL